MEKSENDQTLSIDENLDTNVADKLNTDLSLILHGKVFKCHRSKLSTASPFFESKFKSNKTKTEFEIDWDDLETFEKVHDYIYSGKLIITKDNFHKLLELANFLSITKLKSYCAHYIECFTNLDNCLKCKELCENFKLDNQLLEHVLDFINDNLMEVLNLDEFLQMPFKSVELFFTDPATGCDNVPLISLLEVLGKWVKKDVKQRIIEYQKLLSILDWSSCSSEVFTYLKSEKLFEESRQCLYSVLNAMETNSIDLEVFDSEYVELKKIYEIDLYASSNKSESSNDLSQPSTKPRSSKRSSGKSQPSNDAINIDSAGEERTRQGRRQIKRKFDTHEWVTTNANSGKKQKKNFISSVAFDSETDQAIYMIKVNSSGENSGASVEKATNEVNLVSANEKTASRSTIAKQSTIDDSQLSPSQQIAIVQIETQNQDSNAEFDESEYDIEVNSETKEELLSMKTEYSVRGKKHTATLAQWKEGVKCPKCTYVGHSAPRLEQHLSKVHQEDTTYVCKYCEFTCKWNREYYKHMKTHFKGPPYNCSECDYTCDRVQFILSHLMRHTDERPFACDHCSFRSRTKGNLVVHHRIHTGEKPYKCQFCDKKFAMKNTLDQHMATHRDDRPYLCDKCGFTTKYQSHLLSHKRIHTGNVFYCEQENCSYYSPRKSQLAAHMRSHLMIRSHVCETCGRAFIERSHLIRHERIHLDEKPFKCEQCDYGSTRRDKLKEHVNKHHDQNSEKTFKPRKSKKNDAISMNASANSSNKQQSTPQQYQYVHFENAEQIPEEVREQIMAHYQNQTIESQNVTLTIGENVYESELIAVTPVNSSNTIQTKGSNEPSPTPEIQITNVADQEIVTDLVEFVLV